MLRMMSLWHLRTWLSACITSVCDNARALCRLLKVAVGRACRCLLPKSESRSGIGSCRIGWVGRSLLGVGTISWWCAIARRLRWVALQLGAITRRLPSTTGRGGRCLVGLLPGCISCLLAGSVCLLAGDVG